MAQMWEFVDALRALSVKVESALLLLARSGEAIKMIGTPEFSTIDGRRAIALPVPGGWPQLFL